MQTIVTVLDGEAGRPIFINDLADLVMLVEGGRRIHARLSELAVARAGILIVMFAGLYGWLYSMLR